jgi:hypothetical protein
MVGYRKLILGLAYIGCSTFLIHAAIQAGSDLVGIGTAVAALGGGTFGVIWGNIKAKESKQ